MMIMLTFIYFFLKGMRFETRELMNFFDSESLEWIFYDSKGNNNTLDVSKTIRTDYTRSFWSSFTANRIRIFGSTEWTKVCLPSKIFTGETFFQTILIFLTNQSEKKHCICAGFITFFFYKIKKKKIKKKWKKNLLIPLSQNLVHNSAIKKMRFLLPFVRF